jgi:glycosyltransferase involved in cell wall biosynthesis
MSTAPFSLSPSSAPPLRTAIVVPCFNEAARLDGEAFARFAHSAGIDFLFVNDGSRDGTQAVLRDLAQRYPQHLSMLELAHNRGKAEAVRQGMLHVLKREVDLVGYCDADLATPLAEMAAMRDVLGARTDLFMVLGARVQMLGRRIERHAYRHYAGRLFATIASLALGVPVYDTQCGAKVMRAGASTGALFAQPFITGWAFDVELIRRVILALADDRAAARACLYEHPLSAWRDVAGSKVRTSDFVRCLMQVARMTRHYRNRTLTGPTMPPLQWNTPAAQPAQARRAA